MKRSIDFALHGRALSHDSSPDLALPPSALERRWIDARSAYV
jgi:hypothetical protein